MKYQNLLQSVLLNDPMRMNALYAVQALELNDGWIGAGFVRDAVWDHLHGYGQRPVSGDVDVVWFDAKSATSACDSALEERLSQQNSVFNWSVKNQARMHQRNGHQPYRSTENALLYWPETATAIAVRLGATDHVEVIAPYGLDDLFELRLRPTPVFAQHKLAIFSQRVAEKRWLQRYPGLRLLGAEKVNIDVADDGTATVTGDVGSQEDKEKILVAVGNVTGVGQVNDSVKVTQSGAESRYYTVKSGDTLSAISKAMYGSANEYQRIFEANKPMLTHPDKIYPGQVLIIPAK